MNARATRGPRPAGPELRVLARWEVHLAWMIDHTARWPKSVRFTMTQRVVNLALDVLDALIVARYEPRRRGAELRAVNLMLERLRFLFRTAREARVMPPRGFERAMRGLDETGRMVHGWRSAVPRAGRPA